MRYRHITLTVVAAATLVATGVVTTPASAALVTSCTGTASNVTVPNDLFVPAGKSCELTNVTVNGNTTVRAGANLVLTTSSLNGTLTLQSDGFANAAGSTVTGATKLNSAFGAYTENSDLNGSVVVTGSGFFYSLGSRLSAVTSTNGETYLESARLAKALTTSGDVLTDVYNSVILGGVTVSGASLGSVMCVSEVDGNASFSTGSADGVLQIGASAPLAGCGFNVFAGNLAVTDNTAPSYVSDNVVRGTLVCTGNTPATVVGSTARVRGQISGQCGAAQAAARSAAKSALTADPTAGADRKADLAAKADSRTTEGTAEAVQAGPAHIGS
jgi:hypothetical protein